ncbi:MAG TPA: tetratricopeptide repeat protein, partial [Chthonomonadaceae bacterium]|nr:tetratricopeptide repeat protein [Chthonomonadaceae bacterium]
EVGRDNLSTTLAQLRRQLEPVGVAAGSVIQADRQQVWLHSETVTTDVADFDRLVSDAARCEQKEKRTALLAQAVSLYQGDLLPDRSEEWALPEQSRCQQSYLQSLHQLERLEEEAGHYEAALVLAQRALQTDPYQEEAYQAQMRLQVRLKRPGLALEVYEAALQRFQNELGVLPSLKTRRMAEQIRQNPNIVLAQQEPAALSDAASSPDKPSAPHPVSPASKLPLVLSRFIGRVSELEHLQHLLQHPSTRLLTLLGPGGAGKTRLALELAHQMAPTLQQNAWFVSLADLPDPSLLPSALLHTLHLTSLPQTDPLDQIASALGNQPGLLILDNFEHLLRETAEGKNELPVRGGPALVRMLLERAPHIKCLITSRQALRLEGEQEFVLPPLALPAAELPASLETLLANESVALYVDRARLARADFALTSSNASAVSALCRKLEGMPLALEMAAAWARTLPPGKMLERLEHQLGLLVSRRSDLPLRHQSLRATIEWSYALLSPELQEAFVRLSVFRGGCSLDAAEAVVGAHALPLLAELQERSLVVMEAQGEEPRYRMLETLREFGQEKLHELGIYDEVRIRHTQCFADKTHRVRPLYQGPEEKQAMDQLALEHDNLREALRTSEDLPELTDIGIDMAQDLAWFWLHRGHLAEGRRWLERALKRCTPAPTSLRSALLDSAAMLMHAQGNFAEALALWQEAVDISRELGDRRKSGVLRNNLAIAAYDLGDKALARLCWEENVQASREEGWDFLLGATLANLGELAYDEGDLECAQTRMEEGVQVRRRLGDRNYLGRDLGLLGKIAYRRGDLVQAEALFAECLQLRRSMEDRLGVAEALEGIAGLARMQGDAERAVSLLAFTDRARAREQTPLPPNETAEIAHHLECLRAMLDSVAFEAAWQQGQAWTEEQACLHAFGGKR